MENKVETAKRLEQVLRPFDIDPSEVASHVDSVDGIASVLLVGSFSQGLANPTSDVDLLAIYPADWQLYRTQGDVQRPAITVRDADHAFPTDNFLVVNRRLRGGQKIQITATSESIVRNVQAAVLARNDSYRERIEGKSHGNLRRGRMLSYEQQMLAHRVYTGVVLRNDASIEALRGHLTFQELADNVAVRATSLIQIMSLDLRGLILQSGSRERETLLLLNHQLLIQLVIVLLASAGEVGPMDKLFFRLLRRHQDRLGEDIVDSVMDRYMRLAEHADEDPESIVRFIDETLARVATLSPLVRAEYSAWNAETSYPLFTERAVQGTAP